MSSKLPEELVKEYIKWYKIAQKTINHPIIPDLSDEEIKKLISNEDWLILCSTEKERKNIGSSENPNIYMYLEGKKITIGITYNSIKSVDKLKNILTDFSSEEKKQLIDKIENLDNKYSTLLKKRIKSKHFSQRPEFQTIIEEQSNKLNDEKITSLFNKMIEIRNDGKIEANKHPNYYFEGPSINLLCIIISQDEEEFKRRTKEMFEIYKICINIKNDSEIKNIKKMNKIKEADNKRIEEKNKYIERMKAAGLDPTKFK